METISNTFIRWYNSDAALPRKDGDYLCQTNPGRYATLPFSTKHQMFNVSADNVDCAIKVQWWAFQPELPQKETEDEE